MLAGFSLSLLRGARGRLRALSPSVWLLDPERHRHTRRLAHYLNTLIGQRAPKRRRR